MDASLNSQIVCRICYSNENKENIANWCNCSGTMGLMHKSCLERWLTVSNSNECEICKLGYDIRFEIVKPTFIQWLFRNDLLSEVSFMYIVSLILLPINTLFIIFAGYTLTYISYSMQVFCFVGSTYGYFRDWRKENQSIKIKINSEIKRC